MPDAQGWDANVDVLVMGTGAGAMTAAIVAHDRGSQVLLLEKTDRYGGSSAMSGGGLWIPNNPLMAEAGIPDSFEEALTYLRAVTRGDVPEAKLRAYLENGPEMVRWMLANTQLDLVALPEYTDYYPNAPGAKPGARSMEPKRFHARVLGDEFVKMREENPQSQILGRIFMTVFDARALLTRGRGWLGVAFRLFARYCLDLPWRFRSQRDRSLTMGNALVAMLRASLLDRGVPLWLETPARELLIEDGRVVGLLAEREGRPVRIRARKAVILAAGGFEGNQAMRDRYLPHPTRPEWSCANPNDTGDAIQMGTKLGAAVEFMDEAWWGPVTVVPGEKHARILVVEKSLPGSVLVNQRGERFVNEATTYTDVVAAMFETNLPEGTSVPSYLIFDATYRKHYPCGPLLQSSQEPDWMLPRALRESHYVRKASTLEHLAAKLGIEPEGLRRTVERFNAFSREGVDGDFHRGETIFDRYYGDERVKPNPCLSALESPPFYGIPVYPGDLGTKGGLKTDARGRVLHESGAPIPGLYAIGNCSGSVMGHTYPGAGATLGPATVFGFIAARDATAG
jgi:3-oxosteroid 1-dehydrogenase